MTEPITQTPPALDRLAAGTRVLVTQQIPMRSSTWTTTACGTVIRHEQTPTGSWFAHAKDDRLWLDRLMIRTDDGEIVELNLDAYTKIDIVP
jgi:major membrane immunogen (membrane-anchored lipoprotein)